MLHQFEWDMFWREGWAKECKDFPVQLKGKNSLNYWIKLGDKNGSD